MKENINSLKAWAKPAPPDPVMTPAQGKVPDVEEDEAACGCFGYLRGIRDRALSLELRFANGDSRAFPYHWLGDMIHKPGVGLLLKFVGDLITLVLIEGNNLNVMVDQSASLYTRGLQRHRITWLREMTPLQIASAGRNELTIARIRLHAYRSDEKPENVPWLKPFLERAVG